jgi:alpha-beta hydrolase superfamily lysophospholipase
MSDGQVQSGAAASVQPTVPGVRPSGREPERARPLWFGERGRESFGMYHAPAAEGGGFAVLLCNPFGYEAMCTHRSYLHLANTLASRGFPVLRFDYHGCGDSSGDDRDPDRFEAWRDSIQAAIDELKLLSRCERVGLFGLRLGANLALHAAATRPDVDALVLWGPFAVGRTFLREELAVHKLRALDPKFDRPETRAPGEIEALGFAITEQTLAAIEGYRVDDMSELPARHVLVMTRETALQERRVADKLSGLGARVTLAAASGYGAMLRDNVTPEETWQKVAEHFETARAAEAQVAPDVRWLTRLPWQASSEVWASSRAAAPVRERAAYFGPDERLFGVVTYADRALESSSKPTLLLLSGGVNHHVGQNRMYTRWARRWAAAGYTSLRFDLAGFGDAGAAHDGRDGKLHSPESVADVRAAMDYLSEQCGSRTFAVVGLCSGALQGFHAALEDARIVSLGLLNWTRFMLDPTTVASAAVSGIRDLGSTAHHRRYQSLRYYVRMAAGPDVWRRLYRGEIDARGIAEHFLTRAAGRVRSELLHRLPALYGNATARTRLARDFQRLAARNVTSCVVYNGDEPILDVFREQLGPHLGRLIRAKNTRLELIDGTDHVFTPLWSQEHVFELMTKYVITAHPTD